jgi:hypothetical protein
MTRLLGLSHILALASILFASAQVRAHLRDPNVPPCFEMRNEHVVPRPDVSAQNTVAFAVPGLTPINKTRFTAGERLNVSVRITGSLCSPYSVFIEPQLKSGAKTLLIQQTSPSLVYAPGGVNLTIRHFVTFAVDPKKVRPGAQAALSSIRITVSQYGSYKPLGVIEMPVDAVWRAPDRVNVAGVPEYECADDMRLPPVPASEAAPSCSNSVAKPEGGTVLDLNRDGICEWAVRDSVCDKTSGNRCYRILEERDGDLQPIAQFYNELTLHQSSAAYPGLSSVERGPLSDLTRYSEWLDGEYATHLYLHDCSRLP